MDEIQRILERHQKEQEQMLRDFLQNLDGRLQGWQLQEPASPALDEASPSFWHKQTSYESAKEQGERFQESHLVMDAESVRNIKAKTVARIQPKSTWQARAIRVVEHPAFEICFALLILSNAFYLAVTVGSQQHFMAEPVTAGFELLFALLYTLEAALRLLALGPAKFITGNNCIWNWFDLFVVISAWVTIVADIIEPASINEVAIKSIRVFRMLRLTQMVRMLRSLLLFHYVQALRQLAFSIVDSIRYVFWALLLLVLVMFIFGLIFTDVVTDFTRRGGSSVILEAQFGSLYASCTTLLRSILGGIDWFEAADALGAIGDFWVQVFHLYVAFCSFAVLNVMTGVFCNTAVQATEKDHGTLMERRHEFRSIASKLFNRLDGNHNGSLTITEFEELCKDDEVQGFFERVDVSAVDAWSLFQSLDVDGDHLIKLEEFIQRCLELKGPARAVDVFTLRRMNDKLQQQMQGLQSSNEKLLLRVGKLTQLCSGMLTGQCDQMFSL